MKEIQHLCWLAVLILVFLGGCASPRSQESADRLASLRQPDGTVIWQEEYQFVPPSPPWKLIDLSEEDYSLAFMKLCKGASIDYPCQSTMAYAEEPFGYSREFEERQAEFFKRFLWASRVEFSEPRLTQIRALGQPALEAEIEGVEPVKNHKVWAKVIFARRGERIVAFYYTQWRPQEDSFDHRDLAAFETFVDSFSYQKPSFYQRLLGQKG